MDTQVHHDTCSVGATLMDKQHLMIIEHMDRLQDALEEGAEATSAIELFDQLLRCMKAHQRDEEEILRSLDYPDLKLHREHHVGLLSGFRCLGNTLSSNGSHEEVRVLKDRYLSHILQEDMKYGEYLEAVNTTIIF